MLAATALGVGSCWINQLHWLDENAAVRAALCALGLEENETVTGAWPWLPEGGGRLPGRRRRTATPSPSCADNFFRGETMAELTPMMQQYQRSKRKTATPCSFSAWVIFTNVRRGRQGGLPGAGPDADHPGPGQGQGGPDAHVRRALTTPARLHRPPDRQGLQSGHLRTDGGPRHRQGVGGPGHRAGGDPRHRHRRRLPGRGAEQLYQRSVPRGKRRGRLLYRHFHGPHPGGRLLRGGAYHPRHQRAGPLLPVGGGDERRRRGEPGAQRLSPRQAQLPPGAGTGKRPSSFPPRKPPSPGSTARTCSGGCPGATAPCSWLWGVCWPIFTTPRRPTCPTSTTWIITNRASSWSWTPRPGAIWN